MSKKEKHNCPDDKTKIGGRQTMNGTMKIVLIIVIIIIALVAAGFTAVHMIQYPSAPKVERGKKHIVCIGDSITYGAGVIMARSKESYPAYLQNMVPEEYQVLNYGLSGRTLQDEGDVPYRQEKFYSLTKEADADIVIIMLGTNDSKPYNWDEERYRTQLKAFLQEYKNLPGQPTVYVMQPSKCFPDEKKGKIAFDIDNDVIAGQIHESVLEVAKEVGVNVIDIYKLTEEHPEWFADGVHPNAEGNLAIAEYIAKQLNL